MALFNRCGNVLRQTVTNYEFMSSVAVRRGIANCKLFVGGLGPDVNSTRLRKAFSAHGEVIKAKVVMDKKSGKCRGYGFVEFPTFSHAWNSYEALDQRELFGQTVTVRFAKNSRKEYTWEDAVAEGYEDMWGGGACAGDAPVRK